MDMIFGIAFVFGVLILVILLTILQLEDPGAGMRLRGLLLNEKLPRTSLKQQIMPFLDVIPVPGWFANLLQPQTVIWAGVSFTDDQFRAIWWLISWLGSLLGVLTAVLASSVLTGTLLGFLIFLFFFALPHIHLRRRIRVKRGAIERSLPDFLDMLTLTIEAGLGLAPAIKRVVGGLNGPLAEELARSLLQIDLGYSQKEALDGLAKRVPSSDLEGFVEAILLAERLGTSLARTMRIQSNLLRTRRRQRAKIQAQTAPIRIIPALVFFFLPSLLLIYLAPPIINFLLGR